MTRQPMYYESIPIGEKFESIPRTVTETDIWMFAYLTGDFFPIHTDKVFAEKTIFGKQVAQGMLVLSIALGMIDQIILSLFDVSTVIALFGLREVRFHRPVYIGDTITATAVVAEKKDFNKESGIVTFRVEVKNQRSETVLTGYYSTLIRKAPGE